MKKIKNVGFKFERWDLLNKSNDQKSKLKSENIIKVLLENRKIRINKEKKEFFKPTSPEKLSITNLGLSEREIDRAIKRLRNAKRNKEKIIIYGDYDTDGITGTAIMWENLYSLGFDVLPYIPERFSEGYGLNAESIKKLNRSYSKDGTSKLKLIITVDNGIVASSAIDVTRKLGIDVIITDHHQRGKIVPKAYSIIHSEKICGSAIAWIFSREIKRKLKSQNSKTLTQGLELAAIGTVADQMPLVGVNRSFAKVGIEKLRNTKRLGLLELFKVAGIKRDSSGWVIGTYEINFMIAPRINAMGRLKHAIDSLRLLCTNDVDRARHLSDKLNRTNQERQRIVEEVLIHARKEVLRETGIGSVLILAHESYHEGVIGLAAGKLVEEFYRPSIVLSKGKIISKASARSIPGFNIIKVIRNLDHLIEGGGGHPMAAGFSIKTENIEEFKNKFTEISEDYLNEDLLLKKLKVDLEVELDVLNFSLFSKISEFEPTGIGNPGPLFMTRNVNVIDLRLVGQGDKHLKLKLEKDGKDIDAIAFNLGEYYENIFQKRMIDIVYGLDENIWNGNRSLELKIRDLRLSE
jgi:single-stranded-DNA-specific exonuclease